MIESAIPHHLEEIRLCPRNLVDSNYLPPFPAWTTRFETNIQKLTVAYFAIQSTHIIYFSNHQIFTKYFNDENSPQYWVPSDFIDAQKHHHLVITAYWSNAQIFQEWCKTSGFQEWWVDQAREFDEYGYFLEIYHPEITEFETIFSNPNTPEGVAHLAINMSNEIQEHAYYGSMKDRLPKAQKTDLTGENIAQIDHEILHKNRIKVKGKNNLCLIRSGQDWQDTRGKERELYLNEVAPILHQGMHFLENSGLSEGCLNCRYMTVLDINTGERLNKTFGLAYFVDLEHLARWAKSHPTHVKIFGSFMHYVQEMQFKINLKLFHEVMTLPSNSQYFEYIRCHPKTGLLKTF